MKTSSIWNFSSIAGKIMMGLIFATMIFGIDVVPALAKNNKGGYYEHENGRRVYRSHGYKKRMERHKNRGYYETVNGRRIYRRYTYREQTYVSPPTYYTPPPPTYYTPPPPVYYDPPQPGIRIFFPPVHIR